MANYVGNTPFTEGAITTGKPIGYGQASTDERIGYQGFIVTLGQIVISGDTGQGQTLNPNEYGLIWPMGNMLFGYQA